MRGRNTRPKILSDIELIKEELEINNLDEMIPILKKTSEYLLIEKTISFADVMTSNKGNYGSEDKKNENMFSKQKIEKRAKESYLTFYSKNKEIVEFEMKSQNITDPSKRKFFCETHQSSIYMPSDFYSFINMPNPTTRNKENDNWTNFYKSKNYNCALKNYGVKVFLCNSSVEKYFTKKMTESTFNKLDKKGTAQDLYKEDGCFTTIDELHITPHGLGKAEFDTHFDTIHKNLFAKDKILVLLEKKKSNKINMYLAFFRNTQFFLLNNIRDKSFIASKYFEDEEEKKVGAESRKGQAKWRDELAELYVGLSLADDSVVECPFTGVKVQYPSESAFLRASHIKAYSKCKDHCGNLKVEEAYDLENGFLVIADVDALFDKYLISVNPSDGTIVKSDLLSKDVIKHLKLKSNVDSKYMSEKKKTYLQIHYNEFEKRRAQI